MKRRPVVKCAAANDEDDLAGTSDSDGEPELKRHIPSTSSLSDYHVGRPVGVAENESSGSRPKRGKQKEFAWMDSGDEDDSRNCVEHGDDKLDDGKLEVEPDNDSEAISITLEALNEVSTFGRMMLIAPALAKRLETVGGLDAAEVVAACQALGRTKFFDGDICRHLCTELCRLLDSQQLNLEGTHEAVKCLHALNCYDKSVFSAVARSCQAKTASMEPGMRSCWLQIFRGFGHEDDRNFLQLLEAPAKVPTDPTFKRIRCVHFFKMKYCANGDSCSWSHDPRAQISPTDSEDYMVRPRNVAETQKEANVSAGVRFGRLRPSILAASGLISTRFIGR